MSVTWRLTVWTRFFDPPDEVWAAKTSAEVLRAEFPPGARFSADDPEAMKRAVIEGTSREVNGRLGPARIAWPVHSATIVGSNKRPRAAARFLHPDRRTVGVSVLRQLSPEGAPPAD